METVIFQQLYLLLVIKLNQLHFLNFTNTVQPSTDCKFKFTQKKQEPMEKIIIFQSWGDYHCKKMFAFISLLVKMGSSGNISAAACMEPTRLMLLDL